MAHPREDSRSDACQRGFLLEKINTTRRVGVTGVTLEFEFKLRPSSSVAARGEFSGARAQSEKKLLFLIF